jgi:pimeloyl-ACP methyl ester carboxylesterase
MVSAGDIVLVHGLWHQPAHFNQLAALLRQRGFTVHAPHLHRGSLLEDTCAVQRVVDSCSSVPIVVGHSYGGSVITGLSGVGHLVFVAAFVPAEGESSASLGGPMALVISAVTKHVDGTTSVRPELAIPALYGKCTPADAEIARSLLVSQRPGHGRGIPERFSWRTTPSTYLICDHDHAIDPLLQERLALRCTRIVRLPSDHSPFISQPKQLADIISSSATTADEDVR